MILSGDIAALQTRLALYEHDKDAKGRIHLGKLQIEYSFSHPYYSSLQSVFADFFQKEEVKLVKEDIYTVCLSIAGPITGKCFNLTNATYWEEDNRRICKDDLTQLLFCPVPILFLNDMEAIGYSIFTLPKEDRTTLDIVSLRESSSDEGSSGEEKSPRCALMLVVDGLGQALWSLDEKRKEYSPSPSEGGHTDFAARNDTEINLLKYFQSQSPKNSPISYEQVLSSNGLLKILSFVEQLTGKQSLSSTFKQNLEKQTMEGKIAMLAEAAMDGNVICKTTWDLFLSILGAQAGNIALTYRADGGVYLTGFVLVELVKQLQQKGVGIDTFFTPFLKAFSYKEGIFAGMNEKTPVYIVRKPSLAMSGAAQHALPFVTKGFFEVNKKRSK